MPKLTKRQKMIQEKVDRNRVYTLQEALQILKDVKSPKFDETVDIVLKLGVDSRKADQMVRGSCALPNGLGKTVRVIVFAKGEKEVEARDAGADVVGGEDLVQKIQEGWMEFDRTIATPDMMGVVGKIAKLLGPRGLMPNPKVGTVTLDVRKMVQMIKAGQVEFRVDKNSNLHAPVGKVSFDNQKLAENIHVFMETILRIKPSTSKGVYLKSCTISSTMGPGIRVDTSTL
ncbi:MAG: 50S ribosomal protein L1 [SAR324 cluster bacterium]|nr:50S ribosomal protein L1 [SAR324 cluster bacterium]